MSNKTFEKMALNKEKNKTRKKHNICEEISLNGDENKGEPFADIDEKSTIDHKHNSKLRKPEVVESKVNSNKSKTNKALKDSKDTRTFYDDFFEDRLNSPFCNLCQKYEYVSHKNKRSHIYNYEQFLRKYNIRAEKEAHYCKTCEVYIQQNLSDHVIEYHDKGLFDETLTVLTDPDKQFEFMEDNNKLWCKPCQSLIDNKRWCVVYHKKTDDHKNKLATYFREHSICKLTNERANNINHMIYCQACNDFLKVSKIFEHIDSLGHVNKIERSISNSQDFHSHRIKDESDEDVSSDESTIKRENKFTRSSSNSLPSFSKSLGEIYNLIETMEASLKRQSTNGFEVNVNKNRFNRKSDSQLMNYDRKITSASVSDTANSETKNEKESKLAITIRNDIVRNFCKVCRCIIPKSSESILLHRNEVKHINNVEQMISDNNIIYEDDMAPWQRTTWRCGFCLTKFKDIVRHVSSMDHLKQVRDALKNPQESYWEKLDEAEYCFKPTAERKYLLCEYCDENVFSYEHLRIQHILSNQHKIRKIRQLDANYIRKYDRKYHCALCLEDFEFGTALDHMKNLKHIGQYDMLSTLDADFLTDNTIIKTDSRRKLLCQTCNVRFQNSIPGMLEHVETVKHYCLKNAVSEVDFAIDQCTLEEKSLNDHDQKSAEVVKSNAKRNKKNKKKRIKTKQNENEKSCAMDG